MMDRIVEGKLFCIRYEDCGKHILQVDGLFTHLDANSYVIKQYVNEKYVNVMKEFGKEVEGISLCCFLGFKNKVRLNIEDLGLDLCNNGEKMYPIVTNEFMSAIMEFENYKNENENSYLVRNFDLKDIDVLSNDRIDCRYDIFFLRCIKKGIFSFEDVEIYSEFIRHFKFKINELSLEELARNLLLCKRSYIERHCFWINTKKNTKVVYDIVSLFKGHIYQKSKEKDNWDWYNGEIAVMIEDLGIHRISDLKILDDMSIYSSSYLFETSNLNKIIKPNYQFLFVVSNEPLKSVSRYAWSFKFDSIDDENCDIMFEKLKKMVNNHYN